MRLLLKTVLGILMAGVLCTLLLVGAYLALAKTPPPRAYAQGVDSRVEPPRRAPTIDTSPIGGFSPPSAAPLQKLATPLTTSPPDGISYRDELNPETGEVRRVPVIRPPAALLTPAELRALELADKIRRSEDDAERAELREQLVSVLGVAFDERRKRQSEAIDDLEKQLDDLRALYAQRGERKDEIVQRRVSELLAEPDVLAWDPAPKVGGPGVLRAAEPVPVGPLTTPERGLYPRSVPPAPERSPYRPPAVQPESPRAEGAAREKKTSSPDYSAALPARDEASPLGDAAQILELLAEVSRIEAELGTGLEGAREAVAKQHLKLARAQLELAEIRWAHTEEMLRNQVDAAKSRLEPAETRLAQYKILHQKGATPAFEVLNAEVRFEQAAAELQAAENLLRAWKKTDAVLRERRGATEPIAEEPREDAETGQFPEQAPAPEQEPKSETVEPSATLDQ